MNNMRKISIALAIVASLFVVVACGNNPKKGKEVKEEAKEVAAETRVVCKEVTPENVLNAIKTNCGVEFATPAGWNVRNAYGTESGMGRTIILNYGQQANAKEGAQLFFDKTKEQTRGWFEQKKATATESYVNSWTKFLVSSLDDHDQSGVGYSWSFLQGPFDEVRVYYYTDPVEIKFELPAVKK